MKKYLGKLLFLVMVVFITFLFISCPNQLNSPIVVSDLSESSFEGYVFDDASRGMAVYVDESGIETLIQSEEESGFVSCVEVIDSAFSSNSRFANRSAGGSSNFWQAIILGKRNDGSFGLWMVYRGGRVTSIIISDDLKGSVLQELIAARRPWSRYFGWSYKDLKIAVNGDEFIIAGSAISKSEIGWHNYSLAANTSIGVYWAGEIIKEYEDSIRFYISRANVIGVKDRTLWQDYKQSTDKSNYRRAHRWMWALRMFLSGWFDKYLVMPASIELGDNEGEYNIYGSDQDGVEGETSVAVVTAKRVLSVEKVSDSEGNLSPYAVIGPDEVSMDAGSGSSQTVTLLTNAPDGVDISFVSNQQLPSYATLDPDTGIITIINADWNNGDSYDLLITVWLVDDQGLTSLEFVLTIHFGS